MNTFDYENDPLAAGQIATLRELLAEEWSDKARDGFLLLAGRFIDYTSTDRTPELAPLFRTELPEGRSVLRRSLEALFDHVGGFDKFEQDYPAVINE